MKTLQKFLVESRKGQLGDLGDGSNPEVIISGYGTMSLKSLKSDILRSIRSAVDRAERQDNYKNLHHELYERNSAILRKLEALLDVEKELDTPAMKRRMTVLKKRR